MPSGFFRSTQRERLLRLNAGKKPTAMPVRRRVLSPAGAGSIFSKDTSGTKIVLNASSDIEFQDTASQTALGFATGTGTEIGRISGLLGSVQSPPLWQSPTFVLPAVPLWPIVAVVVAATVLTLVAAVVPTRLATRVAPVAALAE